MRIFALAAAVAVIGLSASTILANAEYVGKCDGKVKVTKGHPFAGLRSELHWTQDGRDMLDNTMVIERVEGDTVYGIYAWEKTQPEWFITSAQCTREKGTIEGDTIVFRFPKNKGEARYLVQDGVVVGATYIYDGTYRFPARINGVIASAEQ